MYINNVTGKPIKDISFEGYMFSIPAGVSACYRPFGEFILGTIYKPAGEGGGIPPVIRAAATQWKGDRYVGVTRFTLDSTLVPSRSDLVKIAKKRGIDALVIEQWQEDESIGNEEIAHAINELEVPEHIAFPTIEEASTSAQAQADEDTAAAALGGNATPLLQQLQQPPLAAPVRRAAVKPRSARKPATKAPTTPKTAATPTA